MAMAGQIEIGAGLSLSGSTYVSANGLTLAYVKNAGAATCAGAQLATLGAANAANNGCYNGSTLTSGFSEGPYSSTLYSGALSPAGNGVGSGGLTGSQVPNGTVAGEQQLTASGVTYAMINDGTNKNDWSIGTGTTLNTITIPVGVFNVTDIDTMLNDYIGSAGVGSDVITVQFNFGSLSNTISSSSPVYTLTDGNGIRNTIDCTAAQPSGAPPSSCNSLATGFSGNTGYANVTASNVWNGVYTGGTTTGVMNYNNTTGVLNLDAQNFSFGTSELGLYLVDIVITDQTNVANTTRVGLSAITIQTADLATPEPSTILLGLVGLAGIGFFRFRNARRSES
jgi:hypothetical protein